MLHCGIYRSTVTGFLERIIPYILITINPLTYVTEMAPKSAKLMRWALALHEFNVKLKYKPGKANVAADCLSRLRGGAGFWSLGGRGR